MTHKLSPEAEKLRDENIEKQGRSDLYCRNCYIDGFNEGYCISLDELGKKSDEANVILTYETKIEELKIESEQLKREIHLLNGGRNEIHNNPSRK